MERVSQGAAGQVWLFSRQTLKAIPEVYDEVNRVAVERYLPAFFQQPIGRIRLFEWLALLLLVPAIYRLTGLLGPVLRPAASAWRRRRGLPAVAADWLVPGFVRLLLIAIAIRWGLSTLALPLLERQFWTDISAMLFVVAVVWGFLILNGVIERAVLRKFYAWGHREAVAILRLLRRGGDAVVLTIAVLVTLHYFGFDPTAALAGLGIGGIAVALAAQKTLENVIGGLSIVLDQAVRVGDTVKLGNEVGNVEGIGLRSTRIRTMGRTMLNVPNGQIANATIETMSDRDKFWLRHILALGLDTPPALMRQMLEQLRKYLGAHSLVDTGESIRVRFLSVNSSSLDVEVFAYIRARDWDEFLQVQEELLLGMLEVVERAGGRIALPARQLHVINANDPESVTARRP